MPNAPVSNPEAEASRRSVQAIGARAGGSLRARPGRLRSPLTITAVLVGLVQTALTTWRLLGSLDGPQGARNLEATYHALLTATALREQPLWQTLGLPIVTLGGPENAGYAWGATVPDRFGQYIYTSFPPGGFWLAALATALPISGIAALLLLNGLLAATTGTLIAAVTRRALQPTAFADSTLPACVVAGLGYVLSGEALQSHGPVYWPQSALQPVLVAQVLVLLTMLDRGVTRRRLLGLAALTAIGGYIEWTEYVFAFGAALLIVSVPRVRARLLPAAAALAGAASLTAVVLFAHFTRRLSIDASISAWTTRASVRSNAPLMSLLDGLRLSVGGTFLALTIVALAALAVGTRGAVPRRWLLVIALLLIPCLENLLLREHATTFTFDRLKDVVPVCVAAGFGVAVLARRRILVAALALLCGTVLSVALQLRDESAYSSWHATDLANRTMLREADAIVPFDCARLATSTVTRGYLNLATGRSVQELTTASANDALASGSSACGTVFIDAAPAFTDLPIIGSITVKPANGDAVILPRPGG